MGGEEGEEEEGESEEAKFFRIAIKAGESRGADNREANFFLCCCCGWCREVEGVVGEEEREACEDMEEGIFFFPAIVGIGREGERGGE